MKISELKKIIAAGGATLNSQGESVHYVRGYQVSMRDCYALNVANVSKVLRAVNSLLHKVQPGEFVGVWIDNGLAYIDVSERVEQLSAAISIGIERKQKSIFDWCLSRCITLAE